MSVETFLHVLAGLLLVLRACMSLARMSPVTCHTVRVATIVLGCAGIALAWRAGSTEHEATWLDVGVWMSVAFYVWRDRREEAPVLRLRLGEQIVNALRRNARDGGRR